MNTGHDVHTQKLCVRWILEHWNLIALLTWEHWNLIALLTWEH